MRRGRIDKGDFSAGEWSPDMAEQRENPKYGAAAERLRNVLIRPQGAAARRDGLRRAWAIASGDSPASGVRIEPFVFSASQRYDFQFTTLKLRIYRLEALQATLATPWDGTAIGDFDWAQALDTFIVAHGSFTPRRIVRQGGHASWAIETLPLDDIPRFAFGKTFPTADGISITPAATTGTGVTLTASADFFTALDVGATLAGNGGTAAIASFVDAGEVTIDISGAFADTTAIPAGGWSFDMSTAETVALTLSAATVGTDRTATFSGVWADPSVVGDTIGDGATGIAEITEFVSPVEVKVEITAAFSGTSIAAGTWTTGPSSGELATATSPKEPVWSARRGWPGRVTFDGDRLALAGSRDLPNAGWLSKSGDYFNFGEGEGLPDEAIFFRLNSDQSNPIVALRSSRNLEIFTGDSVWSTLDRPLTPESISAVEQSRVGAAAIKPVSVEGATLYVAAQEDENGEIQQTVVELLYDDVQQGYATTDLALLAGHLMDMDNAGGPVAMAMRRGARGRRANHVFVVMAGGGCAVLNTLRTQGITGWSWISTPGNSGTDALLDVSVLGGSARFATRRTLNGAAAYQVEVLDPDHRLDCSIAGTNDPASATVAGLSALEGESVQVYADGSYLGPFTVSGGAVTLPHAVGAWEAGLGFAWQVVPMPPDVVLREGGSDAGERKRPIRATISLLETQGCRVRRYGSTAGGTRLPAPTFDAAAFDAPPPTVTGLRDVRLLGYSRTGQVEVYGDEPFAAAIRAIIPEIGT